MALSALWSIHVYTLLHFHYRTIDADLYFSFKLMYHIDYSHTDYSHIDYSFYINYFGSQSSGNFPAKTGTMFLMQLYWMDKHGGEGIEFGF